ncbi:MAG: pyridoxamine 5'-phosphate oxidase [Chitinophagales bacterium]|nr:pyridoxamine 5'-phosphate oxidase [Chitinophagales bacterium]MDW8417904.1 pyridoxamine 5'-phosphate oxidase [Chitinophagales bacterium]
MQHIRRDYGMSELTESNAARNPFQQFERWMCDALHSEIHEPTAMALSTVSTQGKPSSRMVLLKSYDETQGFVFFTNYLSRKGRELDSNPNACLLFYWDKLERQVRIEGCITKVNDDVSDTYFQSRPYESRLSAIISPQSEVIPDRKFLEQELEKIKGKPDTPRPAQWGGYALMPDYFEFWQGRPNRLHDRLAYEKKPDGSWTMKRLAP